MFGKLSPAFGEKGTDDLSCGLGLIDFCNNLYKKKSYPAFVQLQALIALTGKEVYLTPAEKGRLDLLLA